MSVSLPAGSVAEELAARLPDVRIVAAKTPREALKWLLGSEVRFALVQEDVLRESLKSSSERDLRAVGRVYNESLHILVRWPLRLDSAASLRQMRVWADDAEGGSRSSATRFLGSLGIRLAPPGEAGAPRNLDEADVAMIVAVPADPEVCRLIRSRTFVLSPLDYGTLRSFVAPRNRSGLVSLPSVGHLPAETYAGQSEPVPVVSVPVWLVARPNEDSLLAGAMLDTLRAGWRQGTGAGPAGCRRADLPLPSPLPESLDLPLLDGVSLSATRKPWLRRTAAALALAAGLALLVRLGRKRGWHRAVRREWLRDRLTFGLALGLGSCVLLITVVTYFVEKDINENFSSIAESFWSITIYLFSGLEDRTPYTGTGRVVAALGLLLGPAFFAVLSGWLARFFIQRERRMPQNLKNHFLFLNWNERAVTVARELHHPILRERHGTSVIVVLTDNDALTLKRLKESGSGRDEAFEDLFLSVGDPTSERALLNANAQDARTILIFADSEQGGDERTLRSLMMLRRIARSHGLRNLHVVVELLDAGNEALLDEIGRDFPGLLERISGVQVRTFLMAQSALNKGMVQFYLELLQISEDSNEVYALPIPASAVGMDFRDYAAKVIRAQLPDPLTPVGIQRSVDGRVQVLTNPRPGCEESRLREDDRLVVLSYLPPGTQDLPA